MSGSIIRSTTPTGNETGEYTHGDDAIGSVVGKTDQGIGVIGTGCNSWATSQASGSIIITAPGLLENTSTPKEIIHSSNGAKTFVIQHPTNPDKYLVHACLEGPEAAVFYRGEGNILENSGGVIITLPKYSKHIATNFTAHVTPICTSEFPPRTIGVSIVTDGIFKVFGEPGLFNWVVYGKRDSINIEPLKTDVTLLGDGPYTYIE
jgi:hypothetical protein